MGAFIVAGCVFILGLVIAIISELARGMATAPSMIQSNFWPILITGTILSVIIASTHFIPAIGW